MERITVQIYAAGEQARELVYKQLSRRTYVRGTDRERLYLDFMGYERPEANLAITNLNLLPGVKAKIDGE